MPPKAPKKKLHELAVLLPEGTMINDPSKKKDYVLGKQFATGGFGRIYTCKEAGNPKVDLVIKVEPSGNGPLFTEVNVFQRLLKKEMIDAYKKERRISWIGLPYIISCGIFSYRDEKLRYMIIPKYDMSLEGIREKTKVLSAKNTWEITNCVLESLEYVHEKQFTHADIKAANILLEKKGDFTGSVLVDFGLARFSANNIDKPDKKRAHNGTAIFTSSDAHLGYHPSFRGDIEILAYNVLYWLTGSLPWLDVEANPAKVFDKKQAFLKDISNNLRKLIDKSDSASVAALAVLFEVAAKTSYTEQVNFKTLYSAVKKASASCKGKRRSSPIPDVVETKKKVVEESPAPKTPVPKTPTRTRRAAPIVSSSRSKSTREKSPKTKLGHKSNNIPIVSPVLEVLKNCVSPKKTRVVRGSPLQKATAVENPPISPEIVEVPVVSSRVTTRRKFVSKPISPSVKACPQKLMQMVPGMRNFEKGRRSLVVKQISKKYQRMAQKRKSIVIPLDDE